MRRCTCCGCQHCNEELRCGRCADEGRRPSDDIRRKRELEAKRALRKCDRNEIEWQYDRRIVFIG